eukprot:6445489-Pyramimonas_sp.AAC.1
MQLNGCANLELEQLLAQQVRLRERGKPDPGHGSGAGFEGVVGDAVWPAGSPKLGLLEAALRVVFGLKLVGWERSWWVDQLGCVVVALDGVLGRPCPGLLHTSKICEAFFAPLLLSIDA